MAVNTSLFTATEVGHNVHDLYTLKIVSYVFEDEESIGSSRFLRK
jgi:hypothetical protein